MPLALIFVVLCLPLVLGFSPAALRTRWRSCRVLGMVGYEYPLPTPPPLRHIAPAKYRPRKIKVGRFRYITV